MSEWTSDPLFGAAITVGAYALACLVRDRWLKWLHPLLSAAAAVILLLLAADIPYEDYNAGGSIVSFFLGPATIALGTLIYRHWPLVRERIAAILSGMTFGTVFGIGVTALLLWVLGGSRPVLLSMLPKTVTSPVAVEIVELIGGVPEMGAVFTVLTGLAGSVFGPALARLAGIRSDAAIGTAIGTTSHGIGTARLLLDSEIQGSISGFAMACSAILTPILFVPIYWWLL
jgi:putative effector of murein hydrolase